MNIPMITFAPGTDPRWASCAQAYLQKLYDRSHSAQTPQDYEYHLIRFFARSANNGPAKQPQHYTREDVSDFLHMPCRGNHRARAGKPPGVSMVNHRLVAVKGLYSFASTYTTSSFDGTPAPLFQGANPALGFVYGKQPRANRVISPDDLDRLFAAIPTDTVKGLRDKAIFLFYFWTARRREEVARLRWGNIQYGTIMGEAGVRMGWLYRFTSKGHSEQEDIAELPALAKAALDRYIEASGRDMTPDSPLFVAVKGDCSKPLNASSIAKHLKVYARLAGLDPAKVCLHAFRHTAAVERWLATKNILWVKDLLRHQSLDYTWMYVHTLAGTADPGAAILQERFGHL